MSENDDTAALPSERGPGQARDPYRAAAWVLAGGWDGVVSDHTTAREVHERIARCEEIAADPQGRSAVDAVLEAVDAGPPWRCFNACPRWQSGNPEDCTCASGPAAGLEDAAKAFHATYERLAPEHSYQTRTASAVPWKEVPADNRALMIHTVGELVRLGVIALPAREVSR